MRLAVFAVSHSAAKITFLNNQVDRIMPIELTKSGYLERVKAKITLIPFHFENGDIKKFAERAHRILNDKDGFIILLDGEGYDEIENTFSEAALCLRSDFGLNQPKDNSANAFRSSFAAGLRIFSIVSSHFDDYKFQKILLLPVRNFRFDAWDDLCSHICRPVRDRNFQQIVQGQLAALLNRQSPKRRSKGHGDRERFLFDERNLFFQHGDEHHAQPDTATPPHNLRCVANIRWRFGRAFDHFRHFNVSAERPVGGFTATFWDCHGREERIQREDKLDLFTNSFWT